MASRNTDYKKLDTSGEELTKFMFGTQRGTNRFALKFTSLGVHCDPLGDFVLLNGSLSKLLVCAVIQLS